MGVVRVLIADPQRVFAEAVAEALRESDGLGLVDGHPNSAAALIEAVTAQEPRVVLMDYHLDVMSCDRVVRDVVACQPDVRVLVLSSRHHEDAVQQVLDAGAVGYLPKDCDLATVVQAVHRADADERPVFGDRLGRLLDSLQRRRVAAEEHERRMAMLTPRELEVLQWLAAGFTPGETAAGLGATVHTVQTHIRNLKAKTGARTHLEAARMAHGKAASWMPDGLPT